MFIISETFILSVHPYQVDIFSSQLLIHKNAPVL